MWNQVIKFRNPYTCNTAVYNAPSEGVHSEIINILPVNVFETENQYHYQFFVPGFQKEEIRIKEENKMLVITATPESNSSSDRMLREEFGKSKMKRTIRLPKDANIQSIQAQLADGVLKISVQKDENLNKSIQII
ncbi:MAG: Hsp20/alpha crystallin family protein [Saprospiraceae bacterium]|nr:Hsp20/alpha crystallin family protein [Saprospiraceae bacterium]